MKRFLNCAVSTGVEWPKADTAFSFGTWEIIAFAPTQQHDASLHIDVAAHHLTLASGSSVLNQLLSIARGSTTFMPSRSMAYWAQRNQIARPGKPESFRRAYCRAGATVGSRSRMKGKEQNQRFTARL